MPDMLANPGNAIKLGTTMIASRRLPYIMGDCVVNM